jgi:hypothetical protein
LQPQHLQPAPTQHQSFAAYAPMGAPLQYYAPPPDPSLASLSHLTNQQQSPPQQQQQFQYGLGGGNGGYYNPFGDTHGGYPGM